MPVYAALAIALHTYASPARADGPPPAGETSSPDAVAAARVHFTKGRDLYQAGSYREAIVELDAARALDPKAKDLVYNLAIVHEKLGEIDEALRYARLYVQMDLEPAERSRGESYIKRLEGAKSEVAKPRTSPEPTKDAEATRGRLDAATVTVGAVAIAAAGTGVGFGIKALVDQPGSSFKTGVDGTYADLQSRVSTAHTDAVVADACFGVAGAAAIGAVVLYFARYRDKPTPSSSGASVVVRPLLGQTPGLMLGGSF